METKNPIQVADRLFLVLETLAETGPVTLAELCSHLDLNKSTVHRLLCSLIYMGYVKQEGETGKYSLSFKLLALSNKLLARMDILDTVRPYLKKLSRLTGETVHFVQREHTDAVYIYKEESYQNSIRMVSKVGSRIPLYCSGVGKAIAADLDEAQIKALWENSSIQKLTPHTITDYAQFLKKIEEVRKKGYALDDEENELGVRCIAVSIPDYRNKPKYAFSISAHQILHNRYNDNQTKEPIYNRRDSCHQSNRRFHDSVYFRITEFCHVNRCKEGNGNADDHCSNGHIYASQNHGKNPKKILHGFPFFPQQKICWANFRDCRKSLGKHKDTDQRHRQNRYTGCQQKYDLHDRLFYFLHVSKQSFTEFQTSQWFHR